MEGGSINQPGGVGACPISTWWAEPSIGADAGVLNAGPTPGMVYTQDVKIEITGANNALTMGDTLSASFTTVLLNTTGNLIFKNNAGISIANSTVFTWQNGNIVTAGTGTFTNKGGQVVKKGAGKITCDLPYVSSATSSVLNIQNGTLEFGKAGAASYSVTLFDGSIQIGTDFVNSARLWRWTTECRHWGGSITTAAERNVRDHGQEPDPHRRRDPAGWSRRRRARLRRPGDDERRHIHGECGPHGQQILRMGGGPWALSLRRLTRPRLTVVSLHIPAILPTKTYWILLDAGAELHHRLLCHHDLWASVPRARSYSVGPNTINSWYRCHPLNEAE